MRKKNIDDYLNGGRRRKFPPRWLEMKKCGRLSAAFQKVHASDRDLEFYEADRTFIEITLGRSAAQVR